MFMEKYIAPFSIVFRNNIVQYKQGKLIYKTQILDLAFFEAKLSHYNKTSYIRLQ